MFEFKGLRELVIMENNINYHRSWLVKDVEVAYTFSSDECKRKFKFVKPPISTTQTVSRNFQIK